MIGLIVAVNSNNVIGINNAIPWDYPLDLKRFKELTKGSVVIMGRNTWQSIGRPLPNRRNIVISSKRLGTDPADLEMHASIKAALDALRNEQGMYDQNIWFIGGKRIYEEAIRLGVVDMIDVTYVPDTVTPAGQNVTYFYINQYLSTYVQDRDVTHPDPRLTCVRYYRMGTLDAQATIKRYHRSRACEGESCSICGKPAMHKLSSEIMFDDPLPMRHPLTAYVCCEHYTQVLGPATGCKIG